MKHLWGSGDFAFAFTAQSKIPLAFDVWINCRQEKWKETKLMYLMYRLCIYSWWDRKVIFPVPLLEKIVHLKDPHDSAWSLHWMWECVWQKICKTQKMASQHQSPLYCKTQPSTVQRLSSSVFTCCCSFVRTHPNWKFLNFMTFYTVQTIHFLKAHGIH